MLWQKMNACLKLLNGASLLIALVLVSSGCTTVSKEYAIRDAIVRDGEIIFLIQAQKVRQINIADPVTYTTEKEVVGIASTEIQTSSAPRTKLLGATLFALGSKDLYGDFVGLGPQETFFRWRSDHKIERFDLRTPQSDGETKNLLIANRDILSCSRTSMLICGATPHLIDTRTLLPIETPIANWPTVACRNINNCNGIPHRSLLTDNEHSLLLQCGDRVTIFPTDRPSESLVSVVPEMAVVEFAQIVDGELCMILSERLNQRITFWKNGRAVTKKFSSVGFIATDSNLRCVVLFPGWGPVTLTRGKKLILYIWKPETNEQEIMTLDVDDVLNSMNSML